MQARLLNLVGFPLDFEYLCHNEQDICGIKAAQIHERLFRATIIHVQPLAALDTFLSNGKKIWYVADLSSMDAGMNTSKTHFDILILSGSLGIFLIQPKYHIFVKLA